MTAVDWIEEAESVAFIPGTTVVPREWDDWFWEAIGDAAPFTWGSNNRSLVTARRFADHVKESLAGHAGTLDIMDDDLRKQVETWLDQVYELGDWLIDVEN